MATYTKETALYDTGAIAGDIQDASETASNYLTDVTGGGVYVHSADTPSDPSASTAKGVKITDQIDIIRNGDSVASFGENMSIGSEEKTHMVVTATSQLIRDKYNNDIFEINADVDEGNTKSSTFTTDGTSTDYTISTYSGAFSRIIKIETTQGATYTEGIDYVVKGQVVSFLSPPQSGLVMVVSYREYSSTSDVAYSLGIRQDNNRGLFSVCEGQLCTASGLNSHAEGFKSKASGEYSHAEGEYSRASAKASHAEGTAYASGICSHAEGGYYNAVLSGTTASGDSSHSEGYNTEASGKTSHAEGYHTHAIGEASHAQNFYTYASSDYQTALGKYNVLDNNDTYAVIVGNGSNVARSNALTVDWNGNIDAAGGIAIDGNITADGTISVANNAFAVDSSGNVNTSGNVTATGTINAANGAFTVDSSGNVSTSRGITVWNHASQIGDRVQKEGGTDWTTNVTSSADAWIQIGNISLTIGRWIVVARARFTPTSSGNHYSSINISTTNKLEAVRDRRYGTGTYYNQHSTSMILSLTSDATVYVNGMASVAGTWTRTNNSAFTIDAIRIM